MTASGGGGGPFRCCLWIPWSPPPPLPPPRSVPPIVDRDGRGIDDDRTPPSVILHSLRFRSPSSPFVSCCEDVGDDDPSDDEDDGGHSELERWCRAIRDALLLRKELPSGTAFGGRDADAAVGCGGLSEGLALALLADDDGGGDGGDGAEEESADEGDVGRGDPPPRVCAAPGEEIAASAGGAGGDDDDERKEGEPHPILVGFPRRPFCREIASRLLLLSKCEERKAELGAGNDGNDVDDGDDGGRFPPHRPLLSATALGMVERDPPPRVPRPPSRFPPPTSRTFAAWLNDAGDDGILRLMGMRRTVGTAVEVLPPSIDELRRAANVPHRPEAEPPRLTVAGRARAKHAHRGTKDEFFGRIEGNDDRKSSEADEIVMRILRNAVWVNVHAFAGCDESRPTVEARTKEGYGARWSVERRRVRPPPPRNGEVGDDGNRTDDGGGGSTLPPTATARRYAIGSDVKFRGFLEPQMEDGHEKGWRH